MVPKKTMKNKTTQTKINLSYIYLTLYTGRKQIANLFQGLLYFLLQNKQNKAHY